MNGPDFTLPSWLCQVLLQILRARYSSILPPKPPHGFTIGGDEQPYLRRWFITPRGEGPAAYFHQFLRDDDDRALHDHPWLSLGVILDGGYIEHTPTGAVARCVGDVVLRRPEDRHRVELFRDASGLPVPAWTLFLVGKRQRDWGFCCPGEGIGERFVPWQEFTQGSMARSLARGAARDAAA